MVRVRILMSPEETTAFSLYTPVFFSFFTDVRGAASNSAYYGYPELWI
jgi:hypothetical protein